MKLLKVFVLLMLCSPGFAVISSGTFTIGTGQNYATISAFEADLAAALIGDVTGVINADYTDTTAINFSGTVAFSTAAIYLTCADAYWCGGKYNESKARIQVAAQAVVTVNDPYVHLDRLQISSAAYTYGIRPTLDGATTYISNCIIQGRNHPDDNSAVFSNNLNARVYVTNTVMFNFNKTNSGNRVVWSNSETALIRCINCTVYQANYGFRTGYVSCYNCIANDCTDGYFSVGLATSCISNVASDITGNNNMIGNVLFTNAAGGDFSYVSTDTTAINTGMLITSAESDDVKLYAIDGNLRDATPDRGAFEYVASEVGAAGRSKLLNRSWSFIE